MHGCFEKVWFSLVAITFVIINFSSNYVNKKDIDIHIDILTDDTVFILLNFASGK